ncbi:MAG: endonuclease NucS [Acidobacteriales bacterium]|nr:endonuclease NucS [Terriglobales bacterium]
MGTQIKVWQLIGKTLKPLTGEGRLLESELETWIVQNPEILGQDLLIIGRQGSQRGVGRFDLLAIDSKSRLVIIELKRDKSPREAVAQALDYASWLDALTEDDIKEIARDFLKEPLESAFKKHFEDELQEVDSHDHRILLVAASLDGSAERIINYLSERHEIDVNAAFFKVCQLEDGQRLLIRTVLVDEETVESRSAQKQRRGAADVIQLAESRGVMDFLKPLHTLASEQYVWSYPTRRRDGFRYWGQNREGKWQVVFGISVTAGRFDTPEGQVDVWINVGKLSAVTGLAERALVETLKKGWQFSEGSKRSMIRLRNKGEAQSLAGQLKSWLAKTEAASV